MTPFLTAGAAAVSLAVYCAIYSFIFAFGIFYIYRMLRAGPHGRLILPSAVARPNRPMAVLPNDDIKQDVHPLPAGE
jgi:cytochrome d ubiquinol oxidase subunit I